MYFNPAARTRSGDAETPAVAADGAVMTVVKI